MPAKSPSKTNVSNAKCISQTKVAVEEKDEEWKESTNGKDEIQEITETTESLEASGTETHVKLRLYPRRERGITFVRLVGRNFQLRN